MSIWLYTTKRPGKARSLYSISASIGCLVLLVALALAIILSLMHWLN